MFFASKYLLTGGFSSSGFDSQQWQEIFCSPYRPTDPRPTYPHGQNVGAVNLGIKRGIATDTVACCLLTRPQKTEKCVVFDCVIDVLTW